MRKVKKILDAGLPADVRLIMTMASHEYMTDGEENALRRFDEIFSLTPDTHAVINGFDFIAVTTTGGCHFDDKSAGSSPRSLKKRRSGTAKSRYSSSSTRISQTLSTAASTGARTR